MTRNTTLRLALLALLAVLTACTSDDGGSESSDATVSTTDRGRRSTASNNDAAQSDATTAVDQSDDLPVTPDSGTEDATTDTSPETAAPDLLSPECTGFCTALCTFLLDCGKEDPECETTCAQSTRYQQMSPAACTEATAVIGLEACPLWLDCGGTACAIDEMCLEILPGISYECAPVCDLGQATPVCPGGDNCTPVNDANGRRMTSFGMCWSLF